MSGFAYMLRSGEAFGRPLTHAGAAIAHAILQAGWFPDTDPHVVAEELHNALVVECGLKAQAAAQCAELWLDEQLAAR